MTFKAKIRPLFRQLFVFVTILPLLQGPAVLADEIPCAKKVENIMRKRNKKFFNYRDRFYRDLDLSFFDDPNLDHTAKAKKLFRLYVERIKHSLTEEQGRLLDQAINNTIYHRSNSINGEYSYAKKGQAFGQITVESPKFMAKSYLEYSTLAHELEHALKQILNHTNGINYKDYKLANTEGNFEHVFFLDEMGAMSAEWLYLSGVPQHAMDEIQPLLEQAKKKVDVMEYRMAYRNTQANKIGLKEYLESNWKDKRYNYWDIRQRRVDNDFNADAKHVVEFWIVMGSVGAMASTGIYYLLFHNDEQEDAQN